MPVEILSFPVSGRTCGLPVSDVQEVLRAVSLTPPPERHSPLEGLINVRGRIVPVVDVRSALGLKPSDVTPGNCLVLVDHQGKSLAFRIDSQAELSEGELSYDAGDTAAGFALGERAARVADQIVPLLDPARLYSLVASGTAFQKGGAG